jgi:hypothetical protein
MVVNNCSPVNEIKHPNPKTLPFKGEMAKMGTVKV